MSFEIPHRLQQQISLAISELRVTLSLKVTKIYLGLFRDAVGSSFSPDGLAAQHTPNSTFETVEDSRTTSPTQDCMTDTTDTHLDQTVPLTEPTLGNSLTRDTGRDSRADVSSSGGETRSSSPTAQRKEGTVCERCGGGGGGGGSSSSTERQPAHGRKRKRDDTSDTDIAGLLRSNLVNFLTTHWKTLKADGLYAHSMVPAPLERGPSHALRLHHHLVLRGLRIEDNLHQ
jgi:hypothetical protein